MGRRKGAMAPNVDEKEKRYYAGSYFSYEDNPKLSAVEAAAKLGDYEPPKMSCKNTTYSLKGKDK